jgi:predicted dehydrogenase
MTRVAIVGCGGIAAFTHVPQLLNQKGAAELHCLCDKNGARMKALCARYGLGSVRCLSDYREVLADREVDAVILAASPVANGKMLLDALKAKNHLLIQKPLLLPAKPRGELASLAAQTDRQVLALPHIDPLEQFQELKGGMEKGDLLGAIRFARIRTTIPGPSDYYADVCRFFGEAEDASHYRAKDYARGRGCLSDMGPYALSVLHYLFGEAKCVASVMAPDECETVAVLTLVPNGGQGARKPPVATIEIGWSQIEGLELCSVFGAAGSLCMEVNGRTVLHTTSGSQELLPAGAGVMLPMSPFRAQQEWLGAIRDGGAPRFGHTVARAVWVADVIDEAYRKRTTPP